MSQPISDLSSFGTSDANQPKQAQTERQKVVGDETILRFAL